MLDAGSVVATLGGAFNPSGFTAFDAAMKKSAATMQASEKQIAASQKRTGAASTVAGNAAVVGAAAAAAGLALSVKAAMSFEKQMSEVKAVTKASAADMATMTAAARRLGVETGVGATQAARGLTELAKGGMSARESTAALEGAVALAQAGNMDLADAASTVVQSLSTFNLKAGDAAMVADGLASAANRTTMDVADFAQAFAQGGSAAQAAGLSFDETLNVLGAMANRFRSGSDMGTSLKTTLTQLAHPTKKAQAELDRLNIDLFDHEGKAKSAAQMVKLLGDRFGEMTPKQRLASAALIAGTDGMRTLLNLSNAKIGDGGIREAGAAADVASDKLDNLRGDWQKLKADMEDIGITVGSEVIPALRDASDQLGTFFEDMREDNEGTFGDAFGNLLDGAKKLVDFNWDAIGKGVEKTKYMLEFFDQALGGKQVKPLKVEAQVDESVKDAISFLNTIKGTKIAPKVVQVVEDGALSTQQKIRALIRLGIPPKHARIIVLGADAAAGKITSVRDLMNSLSSRTLTLTINEVRRRSGAPSAGFGDTPPRRGRASGRRPGVAETSLVGEGAGPEWVGNPRDGWGMVRRPTFMGLGADDWVIPTESRYRGRAIELMASALGIPAFAGGRRSRKKPRAKAIHADPIRFAEYLAPLEAEEQKWQERVQRDVGLKDQEVQEGKRKGKLTKKALEARKKLPAERAQLQQAKRELKSAKDYGKRIEKQGDLANIYADDMNLATTDAQWSKARDRRIAALGRERALLAAALKLAGGPTATSAWARALRKKLGETDISIRDTGQETFVEPSTFTVAEQQRLDALDAQLALAELTEPTSDDQQALRDKLAFLEPILASAQADSSGRGGMSAVAEIARDVKSTRDALSELQARPAVVTADQQAISDQAFERGRVAGLGARIDTLTRATMAGSPTLVFQSYVPPSPGEARRLADYTVGGIGYQGGRPASTERIGV